MTRTSESPRVSGHVVGNSTVDRTTRYVVTDEQLDQLLQDLLANGWPEAIARTAVSMLVSEAVTDTYCRQCGERVKVRHPDWKNFHRTMELILNYLKGKPSEFKQVDITHRTIVRREQLEALSDEELLQIEAGEWTPS